LRTDVWGYIFVQEKYFTRNKLATNQSLNQSPAVSTAGLSSSAVFTNTIHYHIDLACVISLRQINTGYMNVIHAGRYAALLTNKMHMIVVVMPMLAFVFAQSVFHRIVCRGNRMDDSLFHKCLECPVYGDPVVTAVSPGFHVMMCQGLASLDENIQDTSPAFCNTELVTPQY
jgi:hypothetical protein